MLPVQNLLQISKPLHSHPSVEALDHSSSIMNKIHGSEIENEGCMVPMAGVWDGLFSCS